MAKTKNKSRFDYLEDIFIKRPHSSAVLVPKNGDVTIPKTNIKPKWGTSPIEQVYDRIYKSLLQNKSHFTKPFKASNLKLLELLKQDPHLNLSDNRTNALISVTRKLFKMYQRGYLSRKQINNRYHYFLEEEK